MQVQVLRAICVFTRVVRLFFFFLFLFLVASMLIYYCAVAAREKRERWRAGDSIILYSYGQCARAHRRVLTGFIIRERERERGGVTCSVLWRECSRNPLSLARSLCDKNYKIVGFVCDARASFTARRVASRCLGGSFVRALTWNMACEKWRGWRVIKDFGLRVE